MSEEQQDSLNDISTFVALPVDNLDDNALQKSDQFRIIKNAIIKTLSDGSLCIIDANDLNIIQQSLPLQESTDTKDSSGEDNKKVNDELKNETLQNQKSTNFTYKCPKCKEAFHKISSFCKHMMWHRNSKKFKCDKCSVGYNVETNLKIHMAMHGEGKPTCPLCKISFQRLASLKSHLLLHQVEELYTCEECAAEFEREEELIKHFQSHMNAVPESDNLICSYCSVQFDEYKKYKEHISYHVKVKKMVLSGKKHRKTHGTKVYPHACNVCLKSFSRMSLLERHLRVHSGERPYVCLHCNRGFNQKGTLQIHLTKHTGIKPFHCTLCSAKFNQKGNLRVHVEKTHTAPMPGVKTYKCSHCTCIFKKIASLNVHITKSHANSTNEGMGPSKELKEQATVQAPYITKPTVDKEIAEKNQKNVDTIEEAGMDRTNITCVKLAESFLDGTVRRYLVMQKKVNDVRWYICPYCNKEFKKPSDLIRHTRVHTREKPFVCKQCGASFSLKSTLFCHIKTHIGCNSYFCVICMKKFSSLRSVNLHLKKHSEKQSQQYKCVLCNKWFNSIQKAKLHSKEVHNEQSETNETETIQVSMKQPLLDTPNGLLPIAPPKYQTENNEENRKQFQCKLCLAKFSKMPNLNRHMLLHNKERKFKCDNCSKSYCTAHALKEHLLFHSGVKNHHCKLCGKKYTTASLLKRHMITHCTHKPYVCPYCNKSFKSVHMCRKHMNIHKREMTVTVSETDTDKSKFGDLSTSYVNNDLYSMSENQEKAANDKLDSNIHLRDGDKTINDVQGITNSIEIIANSEIEQDINRIQTIFINCEDLQLGNNVYSEIKLQGVDMTSDAIFFNSLNDLQDANVFSIDQLNNDQQNTDQIYNLNPIINNDQIDSMATDDDLTNKILKLNPPANNVPYYPPQGELNLLFNLDSEFVTNNCDLPNDNLNLPDINLHDVPLLNVEAPSQETVEQIDDDKSKKKLTCDICSKIFTNKKMYTKHIAMHNNNVKKTKPTVHQCCFCSKVFKKQSDLIRHIRTHTGEKPFACDQCEKKFSLKSTLLSHQRTHNPVSHKRYNCIDCNSFFTSKSSLKVHLTVHTGDKTHICNFCSMKFRTAAHRKTHEANHHQLNISKKKSKNKVTNSLAIDAINQPNQKDGQVHNTDSLENVLLVQEHLQLPGDSMNILAENNRNLPESTQLLEPMIFQQLQSNFLLQSPFIQLDDGTLVNLKTVDGPPNIKRNDVLVPNQKPRNLECDICHKKYASKDVLRKHKKNHGANKKFPCSKCDKGFDLMEDQKKHEKIHEGYRPYSCMYCTNSFTKEHSLATHMKRIHDISLKGNSFLLYECT